MLEITPVRAFNDNYLWLATNSDMPGKAIIVDPGDGEAVLKALKERNLALEAILITHHHADHTGGVKALKSFYDVPVYGPSSQQIPEITNVVGERDQVTVLEHDFRVLEIPGHTLDHIAYYCGDNDFGNGVLFCGDTLFAGGCGRVFEGTYDQMYKSLQKLASLPRHTRVYCAHEYTLANLSFAASLCPDDESLANRIASEQAKRKKDEPTVPTTIACELATNLFLRCNEQNVREAVQKRTTLSVENPVDVFTGLRQLKDTF